MTALYPYPVNTATSQGFSFSGTVRPQDPYNIAAHTWVEVVSSLPVDMGGFFINSEAASAVGLLMVATGTAGSENIFATVPVTSAYRESSSFFVPIALASGTRVSIAAAINSSNTIRGQCVFLPESDFSMTTDFTVLESGPYNLDGGSTEYGDWASVDSSATANTLGPWTEASITTTNSAAYNKINGDSLDQNYRYLGPIFNSQFNSANQDHDRLWTWGYGASGSETALATSIYQFAMGAEQHSIDRQVFWINTDGRDTTGERHAFRLQSSITDAGDRDGAVLLLGLR